MASFFAAVSTEFSMDGVVHFLIEGVPSKYCEDIHIFNKII